MPRGDKTGPVGAGPMTGRGAGYCSGFDAPGYAGGAGFGRGLGRGLGQGLGRGYRCGFFSRGAGFRGRNDYPFRGQPNPAAFDEKTFLLSQAEHLENRLKEVKSRLDGLNGDSN